MRILFLTDDRLKTLRQIQEQPYDDCDSEKISHEEFLKIHESWEKITADYYYLLYGMQPLIEIDPTDGENTPS